MSIRWVIRDRENGDKINVEHPGPHAGRNAWDNLSSTIKHCSAVQLKKDKK